MYVQAAQNVISFCIALLNCFICFVFENKKSNDFWVNTSVIYKIFQFLPILPREAWLKF